MPQYLARLAAEATTIINAEDYGRTIHDLAVRRDLILIGEDIVNSAYDAPVDATPREQIEEAERKLYSIAETGRYDGGFQRFSDALDDRRRHGGQSLRARRAPLRHRDRPHRSRPHSSAACKPPISSSSPAVPAWARRRSRPISPSTSPRPMNSASAPTARMRRTNGGIVGFFSLEMSAEQLATRIIAEQSGVPSYKIRRGDISEAEFHRIAEAARD